MNLTPRQKQILELVRRFRDEHGYAPTLQEMAEELEVSTVTVFEHIQALARKGAIRREKHKTRSIEIVEDTRGSTLRLMGFVAAGAPHEAVADEQSVDFSDLFGSKEGTRDVYVLHVRGDSMVDEQIRDGDYVVLERRSEARNGDTVVALLRGEEATLKTFERHGSTVRLIPANATMQPIEVPAEEVEIRGVVRGLLRRY